MRISDLLEHIQLINHQCENDPVIKFTIDGFEVEPSKLELVLGPCNFTMERGDLSVMPERDETVTFDFVSQQ